MKLNSHGYGFHSSPSTQSLAWQATVPCYPTHKTTGNFDAGSWLSYARNLVFTGHSNIYVFSLNFIQFVLILDYSLSIGTLIHFMKWLTPVNILGESYVMTYLSYPHIFYLHSHCHFDYQRDSIHSIHCCFLSYFSLTHHLFIYLHH